MEYTEEILKIAEFMNLKHIRGLNKQGEEYYYYDNGSIGYEALPYYNEWNEIMPVVIKIESFGGDENEFDIFGNCVQLGENEFVGKTKLDAVTKAINYWISKNA